MFSSALSVMLIILLLPVLDLTTQYKSFALFSWLVLAVLFESVLVPAFRTFVFLTQIYPHTLRMLYSHWELLSNFFTAFWNAIFLHFLVVAVSIHLNFRFSSCSCPCQSEVFAVAFAVLAAGAIILTLNVLLLVSRSPQSAFFTYRSPACEWCGIFHPRHPHKRKTPGLKASAEILILTLEQNSWFVASHLWDVIGQPWIDGILSYVFIPNCATNGGPSTDVPLLSFNKKMTFT